MTKLALSIDEACEALGISRKSIYSEINAGRIDSYTVGRRRCISLRALEAYQREREAEAAPPSSCPSPRRARSATT